MIPVAGGILRASAAKGLQALRKPRSGCLEGRTALIQPIDNSFTGSQDEARYFKGLPHPEGPPPRRRTCPEEPPQAASRRGRLLRTGGPSRRVLIRESRIFLQTRPCSARLGAERDGGCGRVLFFLAELDRPAVRLDTEEQKRQPDQQHAEG